MLLHTSNIYLQCKFVAPVLYFSTSFMPPRELEVWGAVAPTMEIFPVEILSVSNQSIHPHFLLLRLALTFGLRSPIYNTMLSFIPSRYSKCARSANNGNFSSWNSLSSFSFFPPPEARSDLGPLLTHLQYMPSILSCHLFSLVIFLVEVLPVSNYLLSFYST